MNFLRLSSILLFLLFHGNAIAFPNSKEDKALLAAGEGYLANREGYQFLTCRFTITIAQSNSIGQALGGEFLAPIKEEVFWAYNGKKMVYRGLVDEDPIRNDLKGNGQQMSMTVPITSASMLFDGTNRLRYSPDMKSVNINPGSSPGHGIDVTPFSMGMMGGDEELNPGKVLEECESGIIFCRTEGTEVIDGIPVISFSFGDNPDKIAFRYSLDEDRGFLPFRIIMYNYSSGKVETTVYLTEIQKCSKGRWFPMRSVSVSNPTTPNGLFSVREIKVTSLDIDTPPPETLFGFDIPKGTMLLNPTQMLSANKFQEEEHVTANDLNKLLLRCQAALENRLAARAFKEGKGSHLQKFIMISLSFLVVICAFFIFLLLRRRKKLHGTS